MRLATAESRTPQLLSALSWGNRVMVTTLLIIAMVAVVLGFLALALTDPQGVRDELPAIRGLAIIFWWIVLVLGWWAFVFVGLAPVGLEGASAWVAAQPPLMRIALWVFLLPWMGALAVWRTGLPDFLRVMIIGAIGVSTFFLATRLSGSKSEM